MIHYKILENVTKEKKNIFNKKEMAIISTLIHEERDLIPVDASDDIINKYRNTLSNIQEKLIREKKL